MGAEVLGISTDSLEAHRVFTQVSPSARTVNFPLVSDRTGQISAAYGLLDPLRGTAQHATFLVDPEGILKAALVWPRTVGRNVDEVVRVLAGLQFTRGTDLVTPANWVPGAPGILKEIELAGRI